MQITVIKTTKAASCKLGIRAKEYLAGETVEIFDELAQVFIKQGWGVKFEEPKTEIIVEEPKLSEVIEEKAIEEAPENKAMEKSPENKALKAKKQNFKKTKNK